MIKCFQSKSYNLYGTWSTHSSAKYSVPVCETIARTDLGRSSIWDVLDSFSMDFKKKN